jgi:hypothetical protein
MVPVSDSGVKQCYWSLPSPFSSYSRPRRGKEDTFVIILVGWSKALGSSAADKDEKAKLLRDSL